MKQRVLLASFFSLALAPVIAFAHPQDAHFGIPGKLSPCVETCLKNDTELHRRSVGLESVQRTLLEKHEACLAQDYSLNVQNLLIFMRIHRPKDYILERLGSFLDQNSIATMECLFGEVLHKINEDTQATLECLHQCAEGDFIQDGGRVEL